MTLALQIRPLTWRDHAEPNYIQLWELRPKMGVPDLSSSLLVTSYIAWHSWTLTYDVLDLQWKKQHRTHREPHERELEDYSGWLPCRTCQLPSVLAITMT